MIFCSNYFRDVKFLYDPEEFHEKYFRPDFL